MKKNMNMAQNTEVKIFRNPDEVIFSVADSVLTLTRNSKQPFFHIALPGGNTPARLFSLLSERYKKSIPWNRIHFWWGDERCVPPDDAASNFKLANDNLFSLIPVSQENIHRMKGEENPEKESVRYSQEIGNSLNFRGNYPVFDLIILGLGDDGHTASIFPGQLDLFETSEICTFTVHPVTKQNRITLTGKTINNASLIFVLVTGLIKARRVSEIMNNDPNAIVLPAYYLSPSNGKLIWYLDEEAASEIS
jgi:6-phosphogluconolactonase